MQHIAITWQLTRRVSDTKKELLGRSAHGTNRLPVVADESAPAEAAGIEKEVERAHRIARMRRRGPVLDLRVGADELRAVAVAGGRKEDAPVRILARARH